MLSEFAINKQLGGVDEVYFLLRPPASSWKRQVEDCLDYALAKDKGGFCYGFASRKAYKFAHVLPPSDPDAPGMDKLCWAARAGQPLAGGREVEATNPNAVDFGCPGT